MILQNSSSLLAYNILDHYIYHKEVIRLPRKCRYYRSCKSYAVTLTRDSNIPVCKQHFIKNIENRVKKTIERYNLIDFEKPDKILVGISGGKDSQTLLTILAKILKKKVPLEALYIELGITPRSYSHDSGIVARKLCDKLGIPFHQINIKEEIGFDIDDVHNIGTFFYSHSKRRKKNHFRGECSYCGLIKRYLINKFAYENGFTKVAVGHNLTDEASALFSNFLNLDIELMARAGPSTITDVDALVPRIKPLYFIYETEMILYAYFANVEHLPTECEYSTDSPMLRVKRTLERIESFRPHTMLNLVRTFQKNIRTVLFKHIPPYKMVENKCKICGMPTYLEICSFCKTQKQILEKIQIMEEKKKKKQNSIV